MTTFGRIPMRTFSIVFPVLATIITCFLEAAGKARHYVGTASNPFFDVTQNLREKLHKLLPDDIHMRTRGKLYISVTVVSTMNVGTGDQSSHIPDGDAEEQPDELLQQ